MSTECQRERVVSTTVRETGTGLYTKLYQHALIVYPLTSHFCSETVEFTGIYIIFLVFAVKQVVGIS